MAYQTTELRLPPMPAVGEREDYYVDEVHRAERRGDTMAKNAAKVGQYVTLALNPDLPWSKKLRYFQHALIRHCEPPSYPSEEIWVYYRQLAAIVREYAGQEALRLASDLDDVLARRERLGEPRTELEDEAEREFAEFLPRRKPDWLTQEDYAALRVLRDHWM
jgi:hypothetical protein